MTRDVLITPASGTVEFKNSSVTQAQIQLDTSNNLIISSTGGDITVGTPGTNVYVGDGVNSVDLIFEQSGAIRGLSGKTLTLGSADSNVSMASTTLSANSISATGSFTSTKANSTTFGDGQIYLNGATGNRIDFNVNGVAAPAFTTRSVGTKLLLYPFLSGSTADFAIGIESGTLWYSVPTTSQTHRWYGGTTSLMSLSGTGLDVSVDLTIADRIIHSGDTNTQIRFPAADTVTVETNGSERMRIDASGNVGIGTSSPGVKFQVVGSTTVAGYTNVAAAFGSGVASELYLGSLNGNSPFIASGGAYPLLFQTNGFERMRIDASGNVGIGTSSPSARLEVVGGDIRVTRAAYDDAAIYFGTTFANYIYSGNTNNIMAFGVNGSERMRIDASGNVGIGTSSPGATLNVVSNSSSDALRITQTGTGNALVVEDSANPDATPFVVDASGNVVLGTSTPTTTAYSLYVESAAGALFSAGTNTAATSPTVGVSRRRTGLASVISGDSLGRFSGFGWDGASFVEASRIETAVDGTPGTNDMPGRLVFSTTADGSSSPTERMRIDNLGRVGINATALTGYQVRIAGTYAATDANPIWMAINGTIPSTATGQAYGFFSGSATQAAAFTLTGLNHFFASQGGVGAGSTLTNQYGFRANSNLTGATNNFGFYSDIASGTGRWNFYANGTANNYFAGPVQMGDGSAAVPALSAFGDTNTGMFFPAADTMAIGTGGSERMRIDASGNVGIGTSSPGNRLDIVGASTSQIRVKDGVNATAYYDFGRDGTDGLFGFYGAQTTFSGYKWSVNAGTEVMRITNAGNVGIGLNNPSAKLDILSDRASTAYSQNWSVYNGASFENSIILGYDGSKTFFGNFQSNPLSFVTNNLERMSIDSSGSVTVATDIRSPIFYDSANTSFYADPAGQSLLYRAVMGPYAGSTTTGGVATLEIKNNGGTGDANVAAMAFHCTGTYAIHMHLRADSYFGIGGWSASAWRWYVQMSTGNMTAAGNVTAYSDPRLKEDITQIDNPVEKLSRLNGVRFRWKDNSILGHPGEYDYGVLANEVQEVFPEIVSDTAHESPDGDKYKAVAYDKLIPVLIEAVKAQQNEINELKTLVKTLLENRS